MQPTSEIINILLQNQSNRIREHFFGHVVSQDACLPLIMKKGPRGENLLFNYGNRNNLKLVSYFNCRVNQSSKPYKT